MVPTYLCHETIYVSSVKRLKQKLLTTALRIGLPGGEAPAGGGAPPAGEGPAAGAGAAAPPAGGAGAGSALPLSAPAASVRKIMSVSSIEARQNAHRRIVN